jgi:hypothetical protein
MKHIFAILFLLLCSIAQAQTCAPADLKGTGTKAVQHFSAAGVASAHWCPGKYAPTLTLHAVRWSAVTPALAAELDALRSSTTAPAAMAAMRAKHTTAPLSDLTDVWLPLVDRINASKPALPVWVVAKNGTTSTRPTKAFLWNDADTPYFTADSTVRATVGATCRCNEAVIEVSTTSWCRLPDQYVMAVCAKK